MGLDYIDRIKQLKSTRNLTNEELSQKSGVPLGTLSKLLAGYSESVKLSNIVAICSALDCSIDYIVTGTPENTNNFTLDGSEIRLIEEYRRLDSHGRELLMLVAGKERERVSTEEFSAPEKPVFRREDVIVSALPKSRYSRTDAGRATKRPIPLFDLPVSAGVGEYLDETNADSITITVSDATDSASYALRISGNSMEPRYRNGDILLVQDVDSVEVGELGIFVLDGDGFFKVYDGDKLLSLNKDYAPIMLKDFDTVSCIGRVIGRVRRK